jgi:hypothetical protein
MTTKVQANQWLKHIPVAIALVGVIASTTWTIAKFPNRDETRAMIRREAPYIEDRAQIMKVVERYDSVYETLQLLRTDVALLTQQIATLNTKLDQALNRKD